MNDSDFLYLDHNATTPCDSRVREAMVPYITEMFWNPNSSHSLGRKARRSLEEARTHIAEILGIDADDILFTGSATEAINLALERLPSNLLSSIPIRPSPVEHRAVFNSLARLQRRGANIEVLQAGEGGIIEMADIRTPSIYVVQAVNSETGVIQDIVAISAAVKSVGGLLICDAAQALWKMPVAEILAHADAAILSGHKAYGPKGVAVLIANREFRRMLRKDYPELAQEGNLREGTVSVAGAVGFAKTVELVEQEGARWRASAASAQLAFEQTLSDVSSKRPSVNFKRLARVPNTSSIWLSDLPGDAVVAQASGIAISYGSACSSGAPEPSQALIASGLSRKMAQETVRISFGRDHSASEGESAALEILSIISKAFN